MFQSPIVGIDIGSHGIKMTEAIPHRGGVKISSFGVQPLPRHAIAVREIIDLHTVSETLRNLARNIGVRAKKAVLSVAGPGTCVKRIQLKGVTEFELPHVIGWEAAQWLPFSADEMQLDYNVVATDRYGKTIDLVVAAAQKELILSHVTAVREAGFTPTALDVDAFALQNAFETNYAGDRPQVIGLIQIGESLITIHLLKDRNTLLVRDLLFGGSELTSRIQERLHLDYSEAEALKVSASSGKTPIEVDEEVARFVTEMIDKISYELDSFFKETPSIEPLGAIYLAGGGSQIRGLAKHFGEIFQVPAEVMAPLQRMQLKKGITGTLLPLAPVAAVSIGLAARRGLRRARL